MLFQGGKSSATHILNGDADAQLRAITSYLAQGRRASPPVGMGLLTDTVVHATVHPVVMRTILPGLDPRSIAVGFPEELSVALDVAEARLGYVWQGGFLNLRRKWTGRGNGPSDLVGAKIIDGPEGTMFRRGGEPSSADFAGYRFDGDVVAVDFSVAGALVTLSLDVVRSDVALGLRLRVAISEGEPIEVALGRRAGDMVTGDDGMAVVQLAAHGDATCLLRSSTLVDDATPRVRATAGEAAEAILWFPTALTDDVVQATLRWRE